MLSYTGEMLCEFTGNDIDMVGGDDMNTDDDDGDDDDDNGIPHPPIGPGVGHGGAGGFPVGIGGFPGVIGAGRGMGGFPGPAGHPHVFGTTASYVISVNFETLLHYCL